MSRLVRPSPASDTRQILEERARAAANPTVPEEPVRWPFPLTQTPDPDAEPQAAQPAAPP